MYKDNTNFFELYLNRQIEKSSISNALSKKKQIQTTIEKDVGTTEKKTDKNKVFEYKDYSFLSEPLNLSKILMEEKSMDALSTIKKSKFII